MSILRFYSQSKLYLKILAIMLNIVIHVFLKKADAPVADYFLCIRAESATSVNLLKFILIYFILIYFVFM